MQLGNSNGDNKGKKYLKIKGDEPIKKENQHKLNLFNEWFTSSHLSLKNQLIAKNYFDEDVFNETYLRISMKILYGGLDIREYASYFHRAYYTNQIQISIKENRYIRVGLDNIKDSIDESNEQKEIMEKQEKLHAKIIEFIKTKFPEDYELFWLNMEEGIKYDELAEQLKIKAYIIQKRLCTVKDQVRKTFGYKFSKRRKWKLGKINPKDKTNDIDFESSLNQYFKTIYVKDTSKSDTKHKYYSILHKTS